MTVAARAVPDTPFTYEAYLAEPESTRRSEILDGVRIDMTNPTRRHQRLLIALAEILRRFERAGGPGDLLVAPCDLLIRRNPLRTRQPDLLFISHGRLARCPPETDPAPLPVGPELVVEILSPSETRRAVAEKLSDYRSVGVQEVWIVSPEAETVELLKLTPESVETIGVVGRGAELRSEAFEGLRVSVDEIFET